MIKREYDTVQSSSWPPLDSSKKKKRKSRWAEEERDKNFIPGLSSVMPTGMNVEQEEQYLLQLQIEDISRRLRTGDLGIPPNPEDRSPSPEPIYNNEGKRLNTREYRTRKRLEDDRHHLVTKALELNTDYKPPADYKPPIIRVNDKVMIPQEEHPDINFVGLLIGPRGNTLKNLEKETGAKIIIRGKGSVKEGKIGRKDGQPLPGEDEPLHAYVTASNPENVQKAVEKIKEIIRQGIEVPEGQNDLRRQQLRELALLNGTLRENDGLAKLKQLQQAQTIITNTIICSICGGSGHIAQDCKQKRPGDTFRAMQNQSSVDRAKMDSEYMSLMAELGEGPSPPKNSFGNIRPPPPNRTSFMLPPPNVPQPALPWQQQSVPIRPPVIGPPPACSVTGPRTIPIGPPVVSSTPTAVPPWQGSVSSAHMPAPTITSSVGVPPMMPPPPPPPSHAHLTSCPLPWQQQKQQQQQQQPMQTQNYGLPPPVGGPVPVNQTPPWQQTQPATVAPVPPPPPMCSMPPWQQQAPPPPLQQTASMPSHTAPPPPPSMSMHSSFNPIAPPPPPPGHSSESHGLPTGIPLGVPPPPPPM